MNDALANGPVCESPLAAGRTRAARMGVRAAVAVIVLGPLLVVPFPFQHRYADPKIAVAKALHEAIEGARHAFAHSGIADPGKKADAETNDAVALDDGTPAAPGVMDEASAYASIAKSADPTALIDPAARLGIDLTELRRGIDAYRSNDLAAGDAIAASAKDSLVSTTLTWTLLKTHPREAGVARAMQFVASHPEWPANGWLRKRIEDGLYGDHSSPDKIKAYFAGHSPETAFGRIALARALLDADDVAGGSAIIKKVWADEDLSASMEASLRKQFGEYLTPADYKRRADRLMYKENTGSALRAADQSGDKDIMALERIRAAAVNGPVADKILASVAAKYTSDAGLTFSKIQLLRRANRTGEAAALMLAAPRDPALLIDGDEWWIERRLVARKLLDLGEYEKAYTICAQHSASSNEMKNEAEFHAGWIALRFLNDPARAKSHFDLLAAQAITPISRARAAYWQGRTAEAAGQNSKAFYSTAAREPATYYGQLARLKVADINSTPQDAAYVPPAVREAAPAAEGNDRAESVRVIEALYLSGAKDIAVPLVAEAARNLQGADQMSALAKIVARDRDAKVSLTLGKLAGHRGFALDDLAFPTYGVPAFTPLPNSASLPVVYAIARQESAFDPKAQSGAGAMGLMQMIASTAKRTAQRAGLMFDAARMTSEPAFNAQLGAAHLGDLLSEQDGSTILTFAAYNAGGKRVKEWIAAYGDPRRGGVDPVDWIERIPFTETRNYVQRVTENMMMYRARLAELMKQQPTAAAPTATAAAQSALPAAAGTTETPRAQAKM